MNTEYKKLRNRYLPKELKTIFVFESPPEHGGYFYDPTGRPGELLFRSLMQCVLGKKFSSKDEGLRCFAQAGYLLVDPIYEPVDKLPDKEADILIINNYPNFIADLQDLIGDMEVSLILVKKTICLLLENKLRNDGFKVLNNGLTIPFPMHYHYSDFENKVKSLLLT